MSGTPRRELERLRLLGVRPTLPPEPDELELELDVDEGTALAVVELDPEPVALEVRRAVSRSKRGRRRCDS